MPVKTQTSRGSQKVLLTFGAMLLVCFLGTFLKLQPAYAIDSRCYYNPLFVIGNPSKCSVLQDKNPYCKNAADCGIQKGIEETKKDIPGIATTTSIKALVLGWLDFILGYAVFFAVIIIVGAGVYLIVSFSEAAFKKVLKILQYVVVGFVIILLAYAIVNTVLKVLG